MKGDRTLKYSVVVPVHNSEAMLPELCERLAAVFESLAADYEIILVDDGSQDASWRVMQQLNATEPRIKIVRLQGSFGQHAATLCGLQHSGGEFVITMDDDLQHPPEEIPKLIAAISADEGCDGVFGVAAEKEHAAYRNLASRSVNRITSYIFRRDPKLHMSSFRIMHRRVVSALVRLRMAEPAIGTMMFVVTRRIKNVTVRHDQRRSGRSGYSLVKMIRVTFNSILNYSALPLQLVSHVGLASAVGSLGLLVYFLIRAQYTTVAGWSSIVVLVTFFGGMTLFTLGLIGEYLVRIIKAVNSYPPYLIAESKGVDKDEESPDPGHRQRSV